MNLLWNMLFGGQDPIGLAINIFIALLFAIGVRDILRGRRAIGRERQFVLRARSEVAKSREGQPPLADMAGGPLLKILGVGEDSLFGQRIVRMTQLREAGMGSRDVLQQLTSEQVGSFGALARQIGSTLTLLGLLGTVFGLSLALVNIGDASAGIKGVDDLEKLSRALAGTMGGMKTAFGCTLAGLISAVMLSFLNHGLRRAQSQASAEIEEFLLCELLPAISEYDMEAEAASKSFAEVLIKASVHLETLTGNVSTAAQEFHRASADFRATLSEVATAVSVSAKELATAVSLSAKELADTAESNREVRRFLVNYHEEYKAFVTSSAETFRKALVSATETLAEKNATQLTGVLQKHLEGLDKMVSHHQGVMQTVSDMVLDVQLNGRAKSAAANGGMA